MFFELKKDIKFLLEIFLYKFDYKDGLKVIFRVIVLIQFINRFIMNNLIGCFIILDYFMNNICLVLLELIFYMKYLIYLKKICVYFKRM